jgi:hypothetical protein
MSHDILNIELAKAEIIRVRHGAAGPPAASDLLD